jgi:hypothetical protein
MAAEGASAEQGPGPAAGDQPAASGDQGTVTLTIDGSTSTFEAGNCVILRTVDVNLTLNSHGLVVSLPSTPGSFTEKDHSNVILPPPTGDEYRPTIKVRGRWSKDGDRASGHVEGVANLLSGIGSGDDRDYPFSFDFECPLSDITGAG